MAERPGRDEMVEVLLGCGFGRTLVAAYGSGELRTLRDVQDHIAHIAASTAPWCETHADDLQEELRFGSRHPTEADAEALIERFGDDLVAPAARRQVWLRPPSGTPDHEPGFPVRGGALRKPAGGAWTSSDRGDGTSAWTSFAVRHQVHIDDGRQAHVIELLPTDGVIEIRQPPDLEPLIPDRRGADLDALAVEPARAVHFTWLSVVLLNTQPFTIGRRPAEGWSLDVECTWWPNARTHPSFR